MYEHKQKLRIIPRPWRIALIIVPSIIITGALLSYVMIGINARAASVSGTVNVAAVVPGPPPTQAPVITSPKPDTEFSNAQVKVEGACTPGLVVKILSNEIFVGSSFCDAGGEFELTISLVPGKNVLTAQAYDALNQSSPISQSVTVTLLSPLVPLLTVGTTSPVEDLALVDPLVLSTDFVYRGMKPGVNQVFTYNIFGGKPPYAVTVIHTDNTQLLSVPSPGNKAVLITPKKPGLSAIKLRAADSVGNVAYLQTTAVVDGVTAGSVFGKIDTTTPEGSLYTKIASAMPIVFVASGMLTAFWVGEKIAVKAALSRMAKICA